MNENKLKILATSAESEGCLFITMELNGAIYRLYIHTDHRNNLYKEIDALDLWSFLQNNIALTKVVEPEQIENKDE